MANKKEASENLPSNVVTLSTDEFGEICQRLHKFLLDRAEDAQDRCTNRPTKRNKENQVELAKDVFVFVHLMELVESMTEEIMHHRQHAAYEAAEIVPDAPEMFTAQKKEYMN